MDTIAWSPLGSRMRSLAHFVICQCSVERRGRRLLEGIRRVLLLKTKFGPGCYESSRFRLNDPKLDHVPCHRDAVAPLPRAVVDATVARRISVLRIELGSLDQRRGGPTCSGTLDGFDIATDRGKHAGNAPRAECPTRVERLAVAPGGLRLAVAHLDAIRGCLRAGDADFDVGIRQRAGLPALMCRMEQLGRERRRRIAMDLPQGDE